MSTKPIDRLLYIQGDACFFCNAHLSKADATVEHLLASSRGGSNSEDNCVACCKSINTLLGNMNLKEKISVILRQKGNFKCPNGAASKQAVTPKPKAKEPATTKTKSAIDLLLANLTSRSVGKPTTVKALLADITSQKLVPGVAEVNGLVKELQAQGKIEVSGMKVIYKL